MSSDGGNKRTKNILLGCGVMLGLTVAFIFLTALLPFLVKPYSRLAMVGRDKIGVVEVFGPIIDAGKILEQIEKYSKDKSIKGILIHINSPGGGVAPSQEIYNAILEAKKKKPVVASMSALAASGGYYIAVGADRIVSNPGTLTGSIGVIMGFLDTRSLMSKIGLKTITVKSGKFKDIGMGAREFTKEDRAVIQSVIDDVYRQFVEAVAAGRNMDVKEVKKLADGRIYSGSQAYELGMVDELGTFRDAVKVLSKLAGVKGEPVLVKEEEKFSFLRELLTEKFGFMKSIENAVPLSPGLHYLWAPN